MNCRMVAGREKYCTDLPESDRYGCNHFIPTRFSFTKDISNCHQSTILHCSIFNICFTCVNAGDANARGLWGGEEGRWRNRSCCDWLRIGQFQKELLNNCSTIVIVQRGFSTLYHQVGLVPLASLLDAADFYMEKEGLMVLEEDQKVILFTTRIIRVACGEYFGGSLDQDFLLSPIFLLNDIED